MKIAALLAGLAFGIVGCVHTRAITESTPADTLAEINRDFAGHAGQVKLNSGVYVDGTSFRFSLDSLSLITRKVTLRTVPNSDIERVIIYDRKRGLVEGLEYGAAIGAVIGAGVGLFVSTISMSQPDDGPRHDPISPVEGILYGALAGAIPGAGLGMFFGTGNGGAIMEVRYHFPVNKPQR